MKYLLLLYILISTYIIEIYFIKDIVVLSDGHNKFSYDTLILQIMFIVVYFVAIRFLDKITDLEISNNNIKDDNDVIYDLIETYNSKRKAYLNDNYLNIFAIIARAWGNFNFRKAMAGDVALYCDMDNIVTTFYTNNNYDKSKYDRLVVNIKYHKSIISDRNNCLVIFAVFITTLFILLQLFEAPKPIELSIKIFMLILSIIGALERTYIVSRVSMYDDILICLDTHKDRFKTDK